MTTDNNKPKPRVVTLKITACNVAYSGKNQRGDDYTIYDVEAEKADGEPINEKLRSFADLPVGQTIEVTVKKFESEQYGASYTLSPKGGATSLALARQAKQIEELTERVEQLERAQQTHNTF